MCKELEKQLEHILGVEDTLSRYSIVSVLIVVHWFIPPSFGLHRVLKESKEALGIK